MPLPQLDSMQVSPQDKITFTCPSCGTKLKVPASMAGVTGPCPQCRAVITAPLSSEESLQSPPGAFAPPQDEPLTQAAGSDPTIPQPPSQTQPPTSPFPPQFSQTTASVSPDPGNAPSLEDLPAPPQESASAIDENGFGSFLGSTQAPGGAENPVEPSPEASNTGPIPSPEAPPSTTPSAPFGAESNPTNPTAGFNPTANPLGGTPPATPVGAPPHPISSEPSPATSPIPPVQNPANPASLSPGNPLASATPNPFPGNPLPQNPANPLSTPGGLPTSPSPAVPTAENQGDLGALINPQPPAQATPNGTLQNPRTVNVEATSAKRFELSQLILPIVLAGIVFLASFVVLLIDGKVEGGISVLHKLPGFTALSHAVNGAPSAPPSAAPPTSPPSNTKTETVVSNTITPAQTPSVTNETPTVPDVGSTASNDGDVITIMPSTALNNATAPSQSNQNSQPETQVTQTPSPAPPIDPRNTADPATTGVPPQASASNTQSPIQATPIIPATPQTTDVPPTSNAGAPSAAEAAANTPRESPESMQQNDAAQASEVIVLPTPQELKNSAPSPSAGATPGASASHAATTTTPPTTTPIAKPVDDGSILTPVRSALETFLERPSWVERLPLIYQAETLSSEIANYYTTHPDGPITEYGAEFYIMDENPEVGNPFYVFNVSTRNPNEWYPIVIRKTDKGFKIDWRIFSEFEDRHFHAYLNSPETTAKDFRLILKRTDYWGSDRKQMEGFECYMLMPPYASSGPYAFVAKDSEIGRQLAQMVPWGAEPLAAIVNVSRKRFEHGQEHFTVNKVVTDGWTWPPDEKK